jgi:hypothetical protein
LGSPFNQFIGVVIGTLPLGEKIIKSIELEIGSNILLKYCILLKVKFHFSLLVKFDYLGNLDTQLSNNKLI